MFHKSTAISLDGRVVGRKSGLLVARGGYWCNQGLTLAGLLGILHNDQHFTA